MSSSECFSRSFRYSGMYRPAWRMNHTGVMSTGSRRHARRNRSLTMSDSSSDARSLPRFGAGSRPRAILPGEVSRPSALLVVVRVLQQDDVRLAPGLADARHVDGRLVLDGAHLLAGAAADAERGVDVRPLDVHRLHRGRRAVLAEDGQALRDVRLLDPDGLRRRRAELLADDARGAHRPRQAA